MCRCGYPFNPERTYDGKRSWTHRTPRRWCSKRCGRVFPARDKAYARKQERDRARLAAWERAGQLTLW